MAVVLAMKKDGLVLPCSRQEGRPAHAPVRSAAVATDECCVALAFTQAPRANCACPSVWPAQLIYELVEDFAGAAIEEEIVIDNRRDSGRVAATASSRLRRRSCSLHRKRLLACPDPHRLPLLSGPRQCEPALKNMLTAGISLNIIVLLSLRAVLSSHHMHHLNPARPLW